MTDYRGLVRARPEVLDPGTSWSAAGKQSRGRIDLLKGVILGLFAMFGPMSHEQLFERFEAYQFLNPQIPPATPQSIRTRTAALVAEGRVYDTERRGRTVLGNACAIWDVRATKTAAVMELELPAADESHNPITNWKDSHYV